MSNMVALKKKYFKLSGFNSKKLISHNSRNQNFRVQDVKGISLCWGGGDLPPWAALPL